MTAPETPAAIPSGQPYDPAAVEGRWTAYWEASGVFHADPERVLSGEREAFVIPMPPPNVTGRLHMGHALQDTVQDLLVRFHRARGFETLWIPGTDHAGIATQNVVERDLRSRGIERKEIGRAAFLEHVWAWKAEYGGAILEQKRRLGDSCDWRFERFTMDDGLSRAVQHTFVTLYEQGLIYRGDYLVNWDPDNQTVLSNEEVDTVERNGQLWTVRYPVVGDDGEDTGEVLRVATTRPETIPADVAVAVHTDDERFRHLVGQSVRVPTTDRLVPVVADDVIKMDFGAGALKVTPGHSEIDFEIGKRHGLPVLSILNPDGTLNELAGPYAGLDRFVAKKQIVRDLDAAGLLEKTEDYVVQTPVSSRSGAVIEPLISPQWYVSMTPLAEPAIAAVKDGTVRFHPERWQNEYFRWLDEVRDWPVSRQLWWGHRIPVWYPTRADGTRDEAAFVVSVDSPGAGYVQDDDTLDTWFSSWLWPFATLGWPDAAGGGTPAMRAFYPASVLVSAHDILFFWIARMIMAGLHFTGEAPFRDVFITGMVKDKQGRKMSKSLGNGIDPLDMADLYGADAVRFTLATLCAQGQDIRLDPSGFEGGRNFANKLWNAFNVFGRFLETDADAHPTVDVGPMPAAESLGERWVVTRLAETVAAVEEALAKYRISEAAQTVYDFVWGDVCDWFLEVSKPAPGETPDARSLAFSVGLYEDVLRLVHPFMPFVTEELWWKLRPRAAGDALAAAAWPAPLETFAADAAAFALVQEIVVAVRQVRAQYAVAPSKRIEATVSAANDATAETLASVRETVERLAGLSALGVGVGVEKPAASAAVVVGRHAVYVPLAGTIDVDAERARLAREIDAKRGFLRAVEGKLSNETFVSRAPEAVVATERQKAADAAAQIAALEATLAELG